MRRHQVLTALRIGLAVLVVTAVVVALAKNWDEVSADLRRMDAGTVALAFAIACIPPVLTVLAWRGLPMFRTEYGPNSFQRHCAQAQRLGAALAVCALPGGRCDIDEPADLLALVAEDNEGRAGNTLKFLHESDLARRLRAMLQGAGQSPLGERYGRL